MKFLLLFLSLAVISVNSHGWMSFPRTRVQIAFEQNIEYCPHCILGEVTQGLEQYANRPYPGFQPFAQPGEGVSVIGPCGRNFEFNDYNRPERVWGFDIVDTFQAGQVIQTEWIASANHLGTYSYRICQNDALNARFLNPNYTPSQADYDEIEKCLEDGILPCNEAGLSNTQCSSTTNTFGCDDPTWGCNNPAWFGQMTRETPSYRNQVRLPANYRSNHTLLTWRWDSLDTKQVYLNCADIRIV